MSDQPNMTKLIVAGSRTIPAEVAYEIFLATLDFDPDTTSIVTGDCPTGPDQVTKFIAAEFGPHVVHRFPADWDTYGNSAGPIRNKEMAGFADQLLLIWDGKSKGSASMKKEMLALGKPVHEVIITHVIHRRKKR